MLYENWLYTGSLNIKVPYCPPLKENIKCECLVIGAGFAGLHAALRLVEGGKKVVILEKRICGGGSSGQSGGFLTPESEEDFKKLIEHYGEKKALIIYNVPRKGVDLIINTAKKYNFDCDLRKQDSFYFSNKSSHNDHITEEAEAREENNFPYKLLNKKSLMTVHPGKGYLRAIRYPGSYGINTFAYCQEMKNLLLKKGVKIYEDSEVHRMEGTTAKTHLGSVTARNIIICIDKMKAEFDEEVSKKYYHIQTYLAISEPLSDKEMNHLYPKGELMAWDTRWDYIHYRPVAGNRILIGGSNPLIAYYPKYFHSSMVINKFIDKLKKSFPEIKEIQFTHYWSGLIDATKDLIPIVDHDKNNKSIQYAMGCVGLSWAAFCGDYVARRILNPKKTEDLSEFLRSDRKFFFSNIFQNMFGKTITFGLSHLKQLLG